MGLIGTIATIQKGAFKGEQGIVLSKTEERVKIELLLRYSYDNGIRWKRCNLIPYLPDY